MTPRRGEIYGAVLSPTLGSEQAGTRPVVVVSRDAINENSPVVVVLPVTGLEHKQRIYPSQVVLKAGEAGLTKDSVVLGEQVRAISKQRLRSLRGRLSDERTAAIGRALRIALDLD